MSDALDRAGSTKVVAEAIPAPRRVPMEAPWNWLADGWRDLWAAPGISLTYGATFAILALLLVLGLQDVGGQSIFLALAGGFLLIGPLAAVGLYETSRQLAEGKTPRLADVIKSGWNTRGQLGFFGAVLLFAFMIWLQIAFLLAMLFLGTSGFPPPSAFMQTLLFTPQGLGLLIVGTAVGGIIAALVFAISVVSVPMLMVRQADAVSAARASMASVIANPRPMMLWAGLIVFIIAGGFATMLLGIVIGFPLLGHATWHAYSDIFGGRR